MTTIQIQEDTTLKKTHFKTLNDLKEYLIFLDLNFKPLAPQEITKELNEKHKLSLKLGLKELHNL